MDISRKRFVEALLGGGALLLISGCGGGDDNDSPTGNPAPASGCGSTIAANHGHVLAILAADLDSPTARTFNIEGGAGHNHTVTLSPTQLQQLKAGAAVSVTSSPLAADGHTHGVNISCVI